MFDKFNFEFEMEGQLNVKIYPDLDNKHQIPFNDNMNKISVCSTTKSCFQ